MIGLNRLLPSPDIVFCDGEGSEVFRIVRGTGQLVAGPGLSNEKATRELFACMERLFPDLLREMMKTAGNA